MGNDTSTRPGCPKAHPTWPGTSPGMGHLLLWAPRSSESPPSQSGISFLGSNLNLLSFSSNPFSLVLVLHALVKRPSSSSCRLTSPIIKTKFWKSPVTQSSPARESNLKRRNNPGGRTASPPPWERSVFPSQGHPTTPAPRCDSRGRSPEQRGLPDQRGHRAVLCPPAPPARIPPHLSAWADFMMCVRAALIFHGPKVKSRRVLWKTGCMAASSPPSRRHQAAGAERRSPSLPVSSRTVLTAASWPRNRRPVAFPLPGPRGAEPRRRRPRNPGRHREERCQQSDVENPALLLGSSEPTSAVFSPGQERHGAPGGGPTEGSESDKATDLR